MPLHRLVKEGKHTMHGTRKCSFKAVQSGWVRVCGPSSTFLNIATLTEKTWAKQDKKRGAQKKGIEWIKEV